MQPVGVLVLVDQDMIEIAADLRRQVRVGDHLRPVEQQVVVIEHILPLLGLDIGAKQLLQFRFPSGAPGKALGQDFIERQLGVHAARIDLQTGPLRRKPRCRFGEAELVPHQVHQIGGILPVMDGEGGIEPDLRGIVAQQFGADGMEGAGPSHALSHDAGFIAQRLSADALHAPGHLGCGAPGEGHQQDAARIGAADDEMGDAMCQRVGLARPGTGNHQQRP